MQFLHNAGCGPPAYAKFKNGLAYGFVPGKVLDVNSCRDPKIGMLVAEAIVRAHSIDDGAAEPEPTLFGKMQSYIDLFPIVLDDPVRQKRLESEFPRKEELIRDFAEIKGELRQINSPVVYCHNDLLLNNVIYDEEKEKVGFIDYEYAAYNYAAYDIAGHFCEFAGVDNPDFSLYPDREFQLPWLRHYLSEWHRVKGLANPTDRDLEHLYVAVNKCTPFAHFFWGVWAIIQAKHSRIDFDYLQYGFDRMKEFKTSWSKFKNLRAD